MKEFISQEVVKQVEVVEPKTHDAVICRRCTYCNLYWDSKSPYAESTKKALTYGISPFHKIDGLPTCNNCGGDTKIASGISIYNWCSECLMHKNRCKCKKGGFGLI